MLPAVVVASKQQLKSSNWEIKDVVSRVWEGLKPVSYVYVRTLCVCATANQAQQRWSDFCLESQSRKQIKEQLNSTTALGPKPNDRFQEALKPLTGLASLPSLSEFLFFLSLSLQPLLHSSIS